MMNELGCSGPCCQSCADALVGYCKPLSVGMVCHVSMLREHRRATTSFLDVSQV
jgi:hypothetical protein